MDNYLKDEAVNSAPITSHGMKAGHNRDISPAGNERYGWKIMLLVLPFGFLWFRLLNNLRLEWATDPQYSYGWVVPLLCLGLLFRRWERRGPSNTKHRWGAGDSSAPNSAAPVLFACAMLAFLYLPTRLVEGATPEWRPIQWLLGFEVIGLTLCAIYLGKGRDVLGQLAFPICFLFVAIPWPTLIETPIIQAFSRFNAAMVVEVMGVLGVPAAQHGNVIEVSTGLVGIDDACSGIRSFQSSLMISLFWGEYYWLSRPRRLLLIPASFLLAIAFNVCRTSILTFIAAKNGTAAINQYHDGAGLAILLACFVAAWCIALLLKPKCYKEKIPNLEGSKGAPRAVETRSLGVEEIGGRLSEPRTKLPAPSSILKCLAIPLLIWLVVAEIGVQLWYQIREAHVKPGPAWSVMFPVENPSFKAVPVPEKTRYLLRFDDGKQGQWDEPDGTTWQAFYFNWQPGRVAGYLAKRHEPEICLPAVGATMQSGPDLTMLNVHGVVLPMRSYVFETPGGLLNVYQCRWEAGASQEAYVAEDSGRYNLIRAVWAGRGKQGQKVLEIVASGIPDPEEAKQALVRELEKMVKVGTESRKN